ncbi:hypothetical protein ACS769_15840 [Yersinia enterocolitica]|uniref:hypothetical protein n=1 Tax=Yersinia enterocolitica TaxID=630 RepID=UPI002DD4A667|nr:hypothetical protein [Yersinia enterocolitica]EME2526406.1 hypothetical protein [Yersinia enterocolitica]HDL7375006.1 hypothetical protein [Yersinia enterocolitica]HDL7384072.1 hypothetical protein [Yersinia enterocolitica]HDL7401596.1 hypothetical protein [Yersinia enterocolitica]
MVSCKVLDMDLSSQCWVVRAGNGSEFFNHFLDNKLAAIGHFDDFINDTTLIDNSGFDDIVLKFYADAKKKELSQQVISANVNQVRKFIFEMNVGDIIFTIGDHHVVAGVITSEPYISEGVLTKHEEPLSPRDMSFKLRRNIEWGRLYPKDDIPMAIRRTFWANQTVFSASEHTKSIYHWLNSVFISGSTVYASSRINQKDDIHHYSVTQFSNALNKIEALAHIIEYRIANNQRIDDITLDEVKVCLNYLANENLLTLTTQQSFMSPGDYWTGFSSNSRQSIIAFTLAFCSLLNVEPAFSSEQDTEIALAMSGPVNSLVNQIKIENNIPFAEQKLELTLPFQNKKVVEKTEEIKKLKFPKVEDSDKGIR